MTRSSLAFFYLLLTSSLFFSCEEVVEPNLEFDTPLVPVIDAWMLPSAGESRVFISKTAPFNSPNSNPKVSDALVIVRERFGFDNLFREETPGRYLPINPQFAAREFAEYTLEVQFEEANYSANIRVPKSPPIDSLTYRFVEEGSVLEEGHYVTFYYQEPEATKNYYYWEVFSNDTLVSNSDINISEDDNFNGGYIELELPYVFEVGDRVQVRLHAFTQEAYNYYEALSLLTVAGSPAQEIPENPQSNIQILGDEEQRVLGFFNATSPSTASIEITE